MAAAARSGTGVCGTAFVVGVALESADTGLVPVSERW
jgi:hypothetical protein